MTDTVQSPIAGGPIGDGRSALADFRPDDVDALRELVRDQVAQGRAIYPRAEAPRSTTAGSRAGPGSPSTPGRSTG